MTRNDLRSDQFKSDFRSKITASYSCYHISQTVPCSACNLLHWHHDMATITTVATTSTTFSSESLKILERVSTIVIMEV